jgi:hypothetical protein
MMLAAIDTDGLLELLLVAPAAAVVVAITFALALRGWDLASQASRDGRTGRALAYGALGVLATLAFAATVAFGIGIIVSKD